MASVTVDTKIFLALYTGASALTLNTTNAPWLNNVVKIIRPSLGTGVNTRQSYNGAYNGATPGGAVSTLQPGLTYEITAGATNGWMLPNFTRVPVLDVTRLVIPFPAGQTLAFLAPITADDQAGTYMLESSTGLTNISYQKNGAAVAIPFALVKGDVLTATATTASGVEGLLTLVKQ